MAFPTITFDSAGSDTQASGSGGTAVFGTGASTNATTAVDLSVDAPDLSGVATDGTAALWVLSSSGRQFASITAVDNGTKIVTVAVAYANTEGSRTWAIGGMRATWDDTNSRTLFSTTGAGGGWTINANTTQSLTSALTVSATSTAADGRLLIQGIGASPIVVTQTANAANFTTNAASSSMIFKNFQCVNTNATKSVAHGITNSSTAIVYAIGCIFGHATNQLENGITGSTNGSFFFTDCVFMNCTQWGFDAGSASVALSMYNCVVKLNGSGGIDRTAVGTALVTIEECYIWGNSGPGLSMAQETPGFIVNNTFHGNSGDNIDLTTTGANSSRPTFIRNNNITGSTGGYGINGGAAINNYAFYADYNNFGTGATANASGARNNIAAGSSDLAVDPGYADAANGDFTISGNI